MGGLMPSILGEENNMKCLILSDTVANKQRVNAGDVIELPIDEARALIGLGKAQEHKEKPKKESDRSVGLKKSEAKVKTRAKGK